MMFRVTDTVRAMMRHMTRKSAAPCNPNRFRPGLERFEDRTVPANVSVIGRAFHDLNGNGQDDAGEPGIPGVQIAFFSPATEYDPVSFSGSAVTDGSGGYNFSVPVVSGGYDFTATPPAGSGFDPAVSTGYWYIDGHDEIPVGGSIPFTRPPQVTVAALADASEGGASGTLEFTRTGDLTSSLTVNISVGGTATSGTDYTALGSTVTFAAGSAITTVTVAAIDDTIYDPDETVTATVTSGSGYSVGSGSSATVTIADDISTVQTLVHQQSFQLTGPSGAVDVTLTVTFNAPGAEGLYTWVYTVSNPSANTSALTTFSIPIDGMDSDVADLASSIGWAGTIGTDLVSWAAGTGLTPGSSATFSFTSEPREIGDADMTAGGGGGFLAGLPTAPAPREKLVGPPAARINFLNGNNSSQIYSIKIDITTASGGSYTTGTLPVNTATANDAREAIYTILVNGGWAVEKIGNNSLVIHGKVNSDKTIDGIKSATLTITNYTGATSPPPNIVPENGLPVNTERP